MTSHDQFSVQELLELIQKVLDDKKAENMVTIDLKNKSTIADYLVIVSGNSARQVGAMADAVYKELKKKGIKSHMEGMPQGDWVLVDAGDVVVHLFRPEVRAFYNLEKMWGVELPPHSLTA